MNNNRLPFFILLFEISLLIYASFEFIIFYRLINSLSSAPATSLLMARISYSLFGVHLLTQFLLFLHVSGSPLEKTLRIVYSIFAVFCVINPFFPFFLDESARNPLWGYYLNEGCEIAVLISYILLLIRAMEKSRKKEWLNWQVFFLCVAFVRIFEKVINIFIIQNHPFNRFFPDSFHGSILIYTMTNSFSIILLNATILLFIIKGWFMGIDPKPENVFPVNKKTLNFDEIANKYALTRREKEILELLALGKSNKEIGSELFISEPTVKTHISHILQKMHVKDRVQLLSQILR